MAWKAFFARNAPICRLVIAHQFALQHGKHGHREAFGRFQNNVADKTVADHDVHVVLEQVVTLDVADEIQIQLFAELEGFECEFVALGILRADAQDADARVFPSEHFARIDIAHDGELREVERLAFDIGAGVQQDKFIALPWNDGGDAAAVHPGNASDFERGRRENAAGVAEGNQRVGLAFADQFGGAGNGRILFFAEGMAGLVVHFHDFAGVDDSDAMVAKTACGQGGVDGGLVANEVKGGDFFDWSPGRA